MKYSTAQYEAGHKLLKKEFHKDLKSSDITRKKPKTQLDFCQF